MMLQIHRSEIPSIAAVIDRFATTTARKLFNIDIYMHQSTLHSTILTLS